MTRRLARLATLAAPLLLVPATVSAQGAVGTLLAQGEHWLRESRPDLAMAAFERVLGADPTNADALAGAAQAEAARGNRSAAEALLGRLRRSVPPGDARIAAAEARLRGASVDRDALAEARRLASAGQTAEAVARYREAFGGATPPDALAVEFYSVLGGSEQGWPAARQALSAAVARQPGDAQAQLALARLLTYREASRAEGIATLRRLATDPRVGSAASAAWRQAVLWLGAGRAAIPELEAFAARHPTDTGIAQRLAEARAAPTGEPSASDIARQRGFEALEANRGRDAESAFEAAIAADRNDADALGGLGIVRLRQGRAEEARALLERAVAAAPARAGQWRQALDGASYVTELAEARAAMRAGRTEAAETVLRQAVAREVPDRADAEALLGDILLRRGEASAAEARYRAALARRPDFGAASTGLERALRDQGRIAEADDLARRRRGAGGGQGGGQLVTGPGAALRAQATRASDPAEATALLRAAMATDPNNPWIRLDLARLLSRQGRSAEGRALMDEGLARGGSDARFAAALFAEDSGRLAEAASLLEQVPAGQRSPDMVRLLARARASSEVAQAAEAARGGGYDGRNRLLAIAARQDPTGTLAAEVVRAFGTLRDGVGAEEAARVALAANRQLQSSGRLTLAGALVEAGRPQAAQALLATVSTGNLTAEQRRQVASLQSGIAIRASDLANEAGDQAGGFERLRPALQRDPSDPAANLALARLYTGARRSAEAVRVAETVLARDPGNFEARAAVVEAAIAGGDLRRAEAALAEGLAMAPNEPRLLLLEARLARARGDDRRAARALEAAAELRRAQTGADRAGMNPFAGGFGASPSDNPFARRAAGTQITASRDAVSDEIARELEALREEAATRIVATPSIRARSGSGGIDRLDEIATVVEASTVPGVIGGRLALRATGIAASSGDMQNDVDTRRRFGSNILAGPTAGRAGTDTNAAGLGLDLAWRRGNVAVDVGTTPLGFRTSSVVGGVEVAPRITDSLRLRATAERRAVNDSLLSWSGQRDPLSGQVWGGVVRSGGRAQLEYGAGAANFYVGGGYAVLDGTGVVDNSRLEAGAGMSYVVFRRPDEELTAGVDLVYFAYDRNLRYFTLGHGGYFSPQSYAAVNLPVDYRARSGDFAWGIGATVGFASWREDAADVFPGDAGRQAQVQAAAYGDPTIQARYAGQSQAGFTGGARGDVEYALTRQLRLGAALRYQKAADWDEARGIVFLRYRVDE